MGDLTWVEQTITVDAIDPATKAIEQNPGWRLLGVGVGSGGQTTLTFGWPWPPCPGCNVGAGVLHRDACVFSPNWKDTDG